MSAKGATTLEKAKILSENVLKTHELFQRNLLPPETQRISNVLEKCINRVGIVATLPAVLQLNRVSGVADEELSRLLQKNQTLEERLRALEGLTQGSNGEQEGEVGEARAQLEKDIKNCVRDLLRFVRNHPDSIFGLRAELDIEIGESETMLITVLKKFHRYMIEKLMTSVAEEQRQVRCNSLSSPAYTLEQLISSEEAMVTVIKKREQTISQKNDQIKRLQRALRGNSAQEERVCTLADKQRQSHTKASEMLQSSIQQEIDKINVELNKLVLQNRHEERELQQKIENVKTEIEFLLQNFDEEIEKKQATLELNEMDYEREDEERRKLEQPFSALEVEFNQILEKRRQAEEKRKEEMRELELKTKAAIFAQAWWRGYSTRKALKNKGKSKKAKKGKGKKTK